VLVDARDALVRPLAAALRDLSPLETSP
jgi:hypothetical protein